MSNRRHFLDMNELIDKWDALGDKTLPRDQAPKAPKMLGNKKHGKRLTADEQLAKTKRSIENKVKDDDDLRVLAPVKHAPEFRMFTEEPVLDPSTICIYCDALLPRDPSALLLSMYEEALPQSRPDVRPSNARGLIALLSVFSPICDRHQFERNVLPKASYEQWPIVIDFKDVETRLKAKKAMFDALINDSTPEGPRQQNLFWQRAVALENKSQGLVGNMQNFDQIQVGYYGERGIVVIETTFRRMLDIPLGSTTPLTPYNFMVLVLTPEAGVLLIMEDRPQSTRDEAIKTMRESSAYGVQMFPHNDIA
ncbi:hypothetical protein C8R44DRAFT_787431 [Mycena epipterygia]|nr:hypothetical protein C8R44DRAFT_787431 [Mycena epipterygia]